jgi:hypothetical protein
VLTKISKIYSIRGVPVTDISIAKAGTLTK